MNKPVAKNPRRRWLWFFCQHEWETIREYETSYRPLGADLRPESYVPIGRSYDLRCKHCGWIRSTR